MTKADEEVEDMAPRRVTAAARPVTSPETVPREDQVVVVSISSASSTILSQHPPSRTVTTP